MKIEELSTKISELEIRFEGLKDAMSIFQTNINNNIYWFYAVLGIFVALVGAVGVALYFLVKSSVKAGVEKGIKDITGVVQIEINEINSKFQEFKDSQEELILKLIKDNPQIKWAKGMNSSYLIDSDKLMKLRSFKGDINWGSPINYFELKEAKTGSSVNYKIVGYHPDGMDILIYDLPKDYVNYEWEFIWITKD